MKTISNRIDLKTACLAIQDANKKIARMQADRDILIAAAIKDFEFDSIDELNQHYHKLVKS